MNCAGVRARAYSYFELALDAHERAEVEAHVASCAACSELWAKACEMTCRDFAAGCGELANATLAPEQRRLYERHLSICRACMAYLASYEKTIELAKASARIDDADLEQLEDSLIASILAARERRG